MIDLVFLGLFVGVGWVVWLAFTFGRVTADRRINLNHHHLAMFAIELRGRDDIMPFLSTDERKDLDKLIDDYKVADHVVNENAEQ